MAASNAKKILILSIILGLCFAVGLLVNNMFLESRIEENVEEHGPIDTTPSNEVETFKEIQREAKEVGLHVLGKVSLQGHPLVHLFANIEGVVKDIHATSGQEVQQGDLLATIFSPELESAQLDLESRLEGLKLAQLRVGREEEGSAELREAKNDFLRERSLFGQAHDALLEMGVPEKFVNALIQGEKINLSTLIMRAPAPGTILEAPTQIGAKVAAERELFTLADMESISVVFDLYPSVAQSISRGDQVLIQDAESQVKTVGIVQEILPKDINTGLVQVRVDMENQEHYWKPDMLVTAETKAHLHQEIGTTEKSPSQISEAGLTDQTRE